MLKAPRKMFYSLNLITLSVIGEAGNKANLNLAKIAPTPSHPDSLSTQKTLTPETGPISLPEANVAPIHADESLSTQKTLTPETGPISLPEANVAPTYANESLSTLKSSSSETISISSPEPKLAPTYSTDYKTFIIGLNVGDRSVNPGVLIRGKVTDTAAIDFENWQIPYEAVLEALKFTSKAISDNEVELRSPFKIVRLNLSQIRSDPELGLVLSVQEIKELFGIEAQFDQREYAIVFDVPETINASNTPRERRPVILDGLPVIAPPELTLSQVEQRIDLNGTTTSNLNHQGRLSAAGTVLGSSWWLRLNQPNLTDRQTWQLSELQVLRQTDSSDYYLGSQPTFWRNQIGNDFWGFTTIQRQGFAPFPNYGVGGANPTQRLQPEQMTATVAGRAEPGTLVRLVRNLYSKEIVAEQLVDASGTYRFDQVPTGRGIATNYQVLLYPGGLLTAEPRIEEARFTFLPEQLPAGASALMVSGGWQRRLNPNNFLGEFTQFNAGVAQRWGVTEELTVGVGTIYDASLNGLAEIFYRPNGSPFRMALSGLVGERSRINADLIWDDNPNFFAALSSDLTSTRYNLGWQISPGLRFFSNGTFGQRANFNVQYFTATADSSTLASIGVDTNSQLNWGIDQRLGQVYLTHRGSSTSTYSQASYLLDPYQAFVIDYQTISSINSANALTAYWSYRSPTRTRYGESLWQAELGYRVGSRGSGIYTTVGTTILPGILLQARYEGVSLTSDQGRFSLQLVSSLNAQRGISPGDRQVERLRTEGGLLVEAFYDKNNNGKRDNNEEIYTDSSEFLVVNHEVVKPGELDIQGNGLLLRLPPGTYRIDLDPAGFPPDFQPLVNALAVEVVAGSYTTIPIPLQAAYTVGGVVTDTTGKPLAGARVEAFSPESKSSVISITNGAGVYYLEQLRQGTYELKVNGKSVKPQTITINSRSETLQELNLQLP